MRVAILGAGTMGSIYANNLSKMNSVTVAGVCDIQLDRAQAAAEACRSTPYTCYEVMMAEQNPDVICICLPTYLHKQMVIETAARKKHVICEKPIALTIEDANEMIQACRENEVKLFIGHVLRLFPSYRSMQQQIHFGKIGNIKMAHAKRMGAYPQGWDNWYGDVNKSGGVITDLMIHDIDYMRWVFGEVKSVYATCVNWAESLQQYVNATLTMENGGLVNLTGYWGYPGEFKTEVEFAGDQGIIRANDSKARSLQIIKQTDEQDSQQGVAVPSSPAFNDPYYEELAFFLKCITEDVEPFVTAEDGVKALTIALAIHQSIELHKPIEVEGVNL